MKAYHFLAADRKLRYGDGRVVVDGETLSCDGEIVLCENGMHASLAVRDALNYAPGAVLCVVEVSGDVVVGDDKIAGRHRRVLWSAGEDVMLPLIVRYAEWCAGRAREQGGYWAADAAADARAAAYANAAARAAASAARAARAARAAHDAATDARAAHDAATDADYAAEREAQKNWWTERLREIGAPI